MNDAVAFRQVAAARIQAMKMEGLFLNGMLLRLTDQIEAVKARMATIDMNIAAEKASVEQPPQGGRVG